MRLDMRKCEKIFTEKFLRWLGPSPALVDRNGLPVPVYRVENAQFAGTSAHKGLVCYGLSPYTLLKYIRGAQFGDVHELSRNVGRYGSIQRSEENRRHLHELERRHVLGAVDLSDLKVSQLLYRRGSAEENLSTSVVFLRAKKILRLGSHLIYNRTTGESRFGYEHNLKPSEAAVIPTGGFLTSKEGALRIRRSGYDAVLYMAQGDFVVASLPEVPTCPIAKALLPRVPLQGPDLVRTIKEANEFVRRSDRRKGSKLPVGMLDDAEDEEDEEIEEDS